MANRKLTIEIVGDAKGLSKTFGEAEKGATALGDTVAKSGSKLDEAGDKMTKFGAAAVAGAALAGAALLGAAGKFSDLALQASKMSDTTGLAVDDVSRWIEVAGDMGIEAGTLEASLNRMNIAAGKTPEKFAEFGVEIARTADGAVDANQTFLNTIDRLNAIEDPAKKAEAAAALLGKGWTGMSELIAEGSDALGESLAAVSESKVIDPDEVAQAKDFRAAMDTLKDSVEDLVISIGQGAAPVISKLAETIGGLISGLDAANDATGGLIGKFGVIAVVGVGAVGALSMITGQVLKMKSAIGPDGNLGKLVQGLKNMGPAGQAGVVAAAAVVVGMIAVQKGAKQAADRTKELSETISDFATVADEALGDTFMSFLHQAALQQALDGKSLKSSFEDVANASLEGARRMLEWAEANGEGAEVTKMLRDVIKEKERAEAKAAETAEKYGKTLDETTNATGRAAEATDELNKDLGVFTSSASDMEAEARKAAAGLDALTADTGAFGQSAQASKGFAVDLGASFVTMGERARGAARDADSLDTAIRNADAAYSALMGKLDAEIAWDNAQKAIDGYIWKMNDGVTSTDALHQEFLKIAPDLATYVANLEGVPPEVKTDLYAALERGDIDEFNRLLDEIPVSKATEISIQTKLDAGAKWLKSLGGISAKITDAGAAGLAGGTNNAKPGPTIVGEDGPELMWMRGGETVKTAAQTKALLSSASQTAPTGYYAAGKGTTIYNFNPTFAGALMMEQDAVRRLWDMFVDGQHRGELVGSLS